MRVVDLKEELEKLGLQTDGLKAELQARLESAIMSSPKKSEAKSRSNTPSRKTAETPKSTSKSSAKKRTPAKAATPDASSESVEILASAKSASKSSARKRTPAKLSTSAALSESLEKAEDLLPPEPEPEEEKEAEHKKPSIGAVYFSMLAKYPFMANATQAALINAAGVIASAAVPMLKGGEMKPIDWMQVTIFMLIGAFVVIPLILYVLVGKLYAIPNLNKLQLLLVSTLFGTFVISGAFEIAYPVISDFLNPDPAAAACLKPLVEKLFTRDFLINSCLKSRIVFLPADIANTFFVPPAFHPLVSNIAGFIWTIVLAIQMS